MVAFILSESWEMQEKKTMEIRLKDSDFRFPIYLYWKSVSVAISCGSQSVL